MTNTGWNSIGYAAPLNRSEAWRLRTWPKWAVALWPIRRGPIVALTFDQYAPASKVYFLSRSGPLVSYGDGFKPMK